MIANIPKISVLVITYNQEHLVSRAIDSILSQKDYIYEICVSDDCSSDKTWEILNDYSNRYPGLFKLNRNVPNIGIFENNEKVWSMPSGDIMYDLAGDDSVGEGWFKTVSDFIVENSIDYKKELFCIYGDYKCIYPNGDSIVHKNNALEKYDDAFRLALRGCINSRSCCYSKRVLDKFQNVSQGRSHIAENAQDRQLQIFSKKNYYIPQVGNIYYSAVGISSKLTEELKKERMQIWPYSIKCFEEFGKTLCKKDLLFIKHRMTYQEYVQWGRKKSAFLSVWYYLRSFDMKIFMASDTMKDIVFAIRRRLPHKYIINCLLYTSDAADE